jgi:hypothetical protein
MRKTITIVFSGISMFLYVYLIISSTLYLESLPDYKGNIYVGLITNLYKANPHWVSIFCFTIFAITFFLWVYEVVSETTDLGGEIK